MRNGCHKRPSFFAHSANAVLSGLILSAFLGNAAASPFDGEDQRFIAGLRVRRFFQLAEAFCERRLREGALTKRAEADGTVEWMRVLSDRASHSTSAERVAHWKRVREVAERFLAESVDHPWRIAVEAERTWLAFSELELERMEFEVRVPNDQANDDWRVRLQAVIRQFGDVENNLKMAIPIVERSPAGAEGPTADDWRELLRVITLQREIARRCQGSAYPKGSNDRKAILETVRDRASKLARGEPPDSEYAIRLSILEASCQRELEDYAGAKAILDRVLSEELTDPLLIEATSERMKWFVDQGLPDEAIAILDAPKVGRLVEQNASLSLVLFEALVARWRITNSRDPSLAKTQEGVISEELARLESQFGGYWASRASLLLASGGAVTSPSEQSGSEQQFVLKSAEGVYLGGQVDQAIEMLDRASETAKAGNRDWFPFRYKAARMLQEQTRHEEAAERLQALVVEAPTHTLAAESQFLACWNFAQVAHKNPSRLQAYKDSLDFHLKEFAASRFQPEVAIWAAELAKSEGDWQKAMELGMSVSEQSPLFGRAILTLAESAPRAIAAMEDSDKKQTSAEAAIAVLRLAFLDENGNPLPDWSDKSDVASIAVATLLVEFVPDGHEPAEVILNLLLERSNSLTARQKSEALALKVVAIAAQVGRMSEAKETLMQILNSTPADLVPLSQRLERLLVTLKSSAREELASLVVTTVEAILKREGKLSASDRRRLQTARARALASMGKSRESLNAFEGLVREDPKDISAREGLATALTSNDDRESLERGLLEWRTIAQARSRGTEPWFRAKYEIARAQFRLGAKTEAAKLLLFLTKTEPGWKTCEVASQLEALLSACRTD